ncbi:DUF4149 domain-containing protein [Campylobacter geochelonis]|uniref:Putative integral membrane protein n=1 Tax=Campylobacter geochelonis TaxID=1780362 RepID=A0A128EJR1_9BACT|nr:DUF4149 domain-containing protein [Campylobacter geochelonis]QKF71556.1 DUF4149 domain-containing membrane protein [Campylobacter geochelonis]CZE49104.1 putative integral membrane protein [Campylobacter geochelonis]
MSRVLNIYLFLLAALIGIEISVGALVAPVIFFPASIIGEGILTHFQSGQLMTQIFLKFNNILFTIAVISIIYEILNFITAKNESFNFKFSTLMLSLINLVLSAAFVFYFTDYIVDAQNLGVVATQNEAFAQIHKTSEWCMKIMMVAQFILFFMRFPRAAKEQA